MSSAKAAAKSALKTIRALFDSAEDAKSFRTAINQVKDGSLPALEFVARVKTMIGGQNLFLLESLAPALAGHGSELLEALEVHNKLFIESQQQVTELQSMKREEELSRKLAEQEIRLARYKKEVMLEKAQQMLQKEKMRDPATSIFTCRKCRCILFYEDELVEHQQKLHSFGFQKGSFQKQKQCTSYFLEEPTEWMDLSEVCGKIACPKCGGRCGTYSWSGSQCSCGTWIAPAIQVPQKRVDRKVRRPPPASEEAEEATSGS